MIRKFFHGDALEMTKTSQKGAAGDLKSLISQFQMH